MSYADKVFIDMCQGRKGPSEMGGWDAGLHN